MARPRDFEEEEVLDRAMEVFWRHGYDGASMAELTKAMELSSPSIYAAFGSKRGLFDAVLTRYRERRAGHRQHLLGDATAREVAERFLFGAIEWLVDPDEPRGCLLIQAGTAIGADNEDVPRAIVTLRGRTKELLTERLARAQQEGYLAESEDPAALARYLLMVFNGLALQAAEGMSKAELTDSAERALMSWPARPRRKSVAGSTRRKVKQ
ncbi:MULTISPECIES: TetR/AcrR family transcriptional regulator [Paraburkholderia]|uniref:TetR/AcrR family transcriptional regulator n=1 Tax=Paraburkholderia TaxID=1822464 RepID=UPI00224F4998|nr:MULTISPECIES: TetR/AcrR family transcriptional regulator [Paraburkholderia]MCX4163022.1 TetR/AcrR family transcriptional regulator [Paraburkholderia megapolitana]MDN7158518.1 TetR/AcrR family transcriptional regulator [Paraburkholderia sp. CHISQ3]MDQ6495565.1 TetR/AcrR family transcriptional regulator [Paraburkholderia megapolitana]